MVDWEYKFNTISTPRNHNEHETKRNDVERMQSHEGPLRWIEQPNKKNKRYDRHT